MNPILLYFLTLIIVFGSFYLLIHNEAKKVGGLKAWLVDLPTTNFRIFVSIVLAILFVISTQLVTIIHTMNPEDVRELPDVVLDTIGLFIFGMMGLDTAAYLGKRLTHKPAGGDDAPPGSTATLPVPGSTTVQTGGPATVTVQPPQSAAEASPQ